MSTAKKIIGGGSLALVGLAVFVGSIFANPREMSNEPTEAIPQTETVSVETPLQQEKKVSSPVAAPSNTAKPSPQTPQTHPVQDTVAPRTPLPQAPRCTDEIRTAENEGYQVYVNAENSRYESALSSALGALQDRGMGFSGQADLVRQQQAQIHAQKLAQLENEHLQRLARYECS